MGILEDMLLNPERDRSTYAPSWLGTPQSKKLEPIKSVTTSLTSTNWDLSLMPLDGIEELSGEISALARHSVETNLFFEPEFAIAALPRMGHAGIMLLCLWEGVAGARTLRFFMPVTTQKEGFPRHLFVRSYSHDFATLGTPLLHRENAGEVAETLLRLLGDKALGLPPVIAFDRQRMDGETIEILLQATRALGLQNQIVRAFERGMLVREDNRNPDEPSYLRRTMGGRRHKEYERLLRRLREKGRVTFEIARDPDEILDAVEGFLTLEASGWKGRDGTALYSLKQIAALSRQAVCALAGIRRCEIHSMRFEGRIISALVCFSIGGEFFTWKMAYDEEFKRFSPGYQLAMNATEHWLSLNKFDRVDSLAAANNNLINRIWHERQQVGTLLVGTGRVRRGHIARFARSLERYDWLKKNAKAVVGRIGGNR